MKKIKISDNPVCKLENKTVLELFDEQVIKNPGKIALKYENRSMSFQELNLLSNQIARQVLLDCEKSRASNTKKTFFVVLILNRSIDMIASILAVLKSGAAYVPIDPDCPTDRLQYIIQDVKANISFSAFHTLPSQNVVTSLMTIMWYKKLLGKILQKSRVFYASL